MQEPSNLGLDRGLLYDRRTNPQIRGHPCRSAVKGGASHERVWLIVRREPHADF